MILHSLLGLKIIFFIQILLLSIICLLILELSLINPWVTYIPAITIFHPTHELPFVVGAIGELFLPFALRHVSAPHPLVQIPLKWVSVGTIPMCIIILYPSFINTPVVKNVPPFTWSNTLLKGALIVGAIFKIKLPPTIHLVIFPFTQIKPLWLQDFLRHGQLIPKWYLFLLQTALKPS